MTFEGRNWDTLSGLSAPLVYYAVFRWKKLGRTALLGWNIPCLGLLRWSNYTAQKQDVYFLSHERKKQQVHAG